MQEYESQNRKKQKGRKKSIFSMRKVPSIDTVLGFQTSERELDENLIKKIEK